MVSGVNFHAEIVLYQSPDPLAVAKHRKLPAFSNAG
jgi:hypothetical protein